MLFVTIAEPSITFVLSPVELFVRIMSYKYLPGFKLDVEFGSNEIFTTPPEGGETAVVIKFI
jgi:hypothetical protein